MAAGLCRRRGETVRDVKKLMLFEEPEVGAILTLSLAYPVASNVGLQLQSNLP